jgi:hypothetical protein
MTFSSCILANKDYCIFTEDSSITLEANLLLNEELDGYKILRIGLNRIHYVSTVIHDLVCIVCHGVAVFQKSILPVCNKTERSGLETL